MSEVTKIDNVTWKVNGCEIWYHSERRIFYCWSCGSQTCEHVHAVMDYERDLKTPQDSGKG